MEENAGNSCPFLELENGTKVYYKGPPPGAGPLPAFFYFSLSGEDSLCLDPYNQPVQSLEKAPLRTFSISLPHHDSHDKKTVVEVWVQDLKAGVDIITPFITLVRGAIQELIERDIIDKENIACGGLSRGGFIATHLAAEEPLIKAVVGFAPLTLLQSHSFVDVKQHPLAASLSLLNLKEKLTHTAIRYYIANRDTMVNTDFCYEVIRTYTDYAFEQGVKSPPYELILSPPIGYKGHGTPRRIFEDGAKYIEGKLCNTQS